MSLTGSRKCLIAGAVALGVATGMNAPVIAAEIPVPEQEIQIRELTPTDLLELPVVEDSLSPIAPRVVDEPGIVASPLWLMDLLKCKEGTLFWCPKKN